MFRVRDAGLTCCTKTTGNKIASETLEGRIFEVSLADLSDNSDMAYRKIKLRAENVQGLNVLTNFNGMDMTRDKLCMLIKKWQTLIEALVDVKTTDGYTLRIFAIGFTNRRKEQIKKTWYAQNAQVKQIRAIMVDRITEEASKSDLKQLVAKLLPETIGKEIQAKCERIFPLQNVYIRKVKVLNRPKFDLSRLIELHADAEDEAGELVDREDVPEAEQTLPGSGGRL